MCPNAVSTAGNRANNLTILPNVFPIRLPCPRNVHPPETCSKKAGTEEKRTDYVQTHDMQSVLG